jgi:hypothetical protein
LKNNIVLIEKYFEGCSKNKKEFLNDKQLLNEKIKELEENNLPLPKIVNNDFEIKKKRNIKEFIAGVYRLKLKLESELEKLYFVKENFYELSLEDINYDKLKNDYDGIYYTKSLISESKKIKQDEMIGIETISNDIYTKNNIRNNHNVEIEITYYLNWLEVDTMILWNIDNI